MRKILIVGATSAIAQETASRFAADGSAFVIAGRNPDRLDAVARNLRINGASTVHCLSYPDDLHLAPALVDEAVTMLGGLDVVLMAHGMLGDHARAVLDYAVAEQIIRVNFLSVVALLTPVAEYMEKQRSGTIIVISSVAGDRGRASNYVYGAAKAAVSAYLQGLRGRLFRANVRVMTVKPGFVDTPMTAGMPKNRLFASPKTVASGIVRAVGRGRDIAYVPAYWRFVMLAINAVPERFFKRLQF